MKKPDEAPSSLLSTTNSRVALLVKQQGETRKALLSVFLGPAHLEMMQMKDGNARVMMVDSHYTQKTSPNISAVVTASSSMIDTSSHRVVEALKYEKSKSSESLLTPRLASIGKLVLD